MANELDETNSGVDLSLKKRKANPSLPNFMKPLSTDQQNKHSANGNNSFFNNFSTLNKSKCTQPNPMLANQMMAITQLLQQQQSDSANTPTNWLANMMASCQQQTPMPTTTPMFDFSALLNSQLGLVPTNQEDQDDNEESPSTSPLSSSPVLQTPRIKVTPAKSRQHNKKGGDDSEEKANSAPPLDKPFCLSDLLSRRESKVEKQEQVDREESPPKVKRLRPDSTPLANLNPLMAFGESPKTPVKGTPKKLDSPVNDVGNQLAMMMSASSAFPSFLAAAMAAGGGMGPGDLSGGSIGMSSSDGDSPQKRARTRITDDQLKVLRQYFDINNSPSEEHIKEMSLKAGLPEKVIKHWFRNTLFKERQRDKDSPYNFNVPPQMSIDLATYEKTGETKVTPLKQTESANFEHPTSNASSPSAEASAHATSPTNPPQSNTTLKCSPASSPHPENGAETPNEEDEEEDEEEDNQTSSPTNETSSSTNTTFAADFLVNLNKAAAVAAMGNYAAVAASMAQQHQLPAGFASFFGATSNSPAIQEPDHQPEEKTLSAMLGLGHFATFSPSSLAPSSNNATSSLVQQPQSSLIHSSSQNSPALVGTGRRANRTRFTDFQLRTLQNFFDKQAYPKDDDLEMLSKKMGLSPRVIVVWFQNARQKARKIYENQPNHPDNNDRFVRTPGANFQCKRCQLVFQRYYELIQHQQKVCYMGDGDAQLTDNKSLEENLSEDEKVINSGMSQTNILNELRLQENNPSSEHQAALMASSLMSSILTPETLEKFNISLNNNNNSSETAAPDGQQSNAQQDLFKLITSSDKTSAESMLKMFKSKERKHQFHKRCPFCGVLFQFKEKLTEHLTKKHLEQMQTANVDVDALPNAEDVLSFSDDFLNRVNNGNSGNTLVGRGVSPLDLSYTGNDEEDQQDQQQSASPTSQSEENDDENRVDTYDDYSGISAFDQLSRNSPVGSSRSSVTPSSSFATTLNSGTSLTGNNHQNSMVAAAAAAAAANSKRYRTHLTPLQVYIMKSLFNDYKTPSMTECNLLGREIGLHKRVVQVWFQNARAKERKSKGEDDSQNSINMRTPLPRCELCCVEFSLLTTTMQDHIFTPSHIEKIKERGASLKGMTSNPAAASQDQFEQPQESHPKSSKTHSSSSNSQSGRQKAVRDTQKRQFPSNQQSMGDAMAQFPYNLMGYGVPQAMPSMIYDPNLIGTPISMLQIPEPVMQQISSDLAKGKQASRFTQDGLKLVQLNSKVSEGDFLCASTMESEVGWACPQCSNVFQQESFLRNHQKLICQGCDGVFRLIQIHYECVPCHAKFGTQDEYRLHCDASTHKSVSHMLSASSSTSNSQTKTIRSSSTTSC